jgi:hypothetical protein
VWTLDLAVQDRAGAPEQAFTTAPSVIRPRDHASVRGAVEVELVRDFVWITAGYAYRTAAVAPADTTATWVDAGAHTVAVGGEAYWRDVTIALGYRRTLAAAGDRATEVRLVNPVGGGDIGVGAGRYDVGTDGFALSREVAWDTAADPGELLPGK